MNYPNERRRFMIVGFFAVSLLGCYVAVQAAGRDALWKIVSNRCVAHWPGKMASPCVAVNPGADGRPQSVVLKDIRGATQFLLLPATQVAGIETASLQRNDAPDYFAAAWDARRYVEKAVGHPLVRDDIGLSINSAKARGQDQLHIHVDCLRPNVIQMLHAHLGEIGDQWRRFPEPLAGEIYWARRVKRADLADVHPIQLVADEGHSWRKSMPKTTVVVAGMTFQDGKPGFVILMRRALSLHDDPAHGEDLQDHACAIAG